MAAAMITGMSGMTVFAEEQQTGGAPQMEQQLQQAPEGMEGKAPQGEAQQPPQGEAPTGPALQGEAPTGQPPQMGQQAPAGQTSQDETPQAPEGEAPTGQAPQAEASQNGQQPTQAPQGEAPQMEQRHQGRGKMDHGQERQGDKGRASQNQAPQGKEHRRLFIDFESCVKDGTISQETYDAIKKYMDENKPERPTSGENNEAKEGEKAKLSEESTKPDLLKDLLDAEVITQDEYDALAKMKEDAEPAADAQEDKTTAPAEEKDDKTTEESA